MVRAVISPALVAIFVAWSLSSATPSASGAAVADVRADADWILKSQLPDGAIANYVDRQAVWPYLSNFAAMGLARATGVTGDRKYLNAAWWWLGWYQAHQDAQGFVTDYAVVNGKTVTTGAMDSTDSYAGTFLLAVREAYRQRSEIAYVKALGTGIAKAVTAIEATQQLDGLTWAKPAWRVKYLMDQAETYAGLLAAAELSRAVGNIDLANRATADAVRMRQGVANLWNASTAAYDWAVHESGNRVATKWSVLYSDSLQQTWAVAFGMVDAPRAGALAANFTAVQPNWAKPLATALFDAGMQNVGYWPVAGLALTLVGNVAGALGATTMRTAALSSGRAWPFTTASAGQLILLGSSGWTPPTAPSTTTSTTTTTTSKPTTTTTTKPAATPTTTTSAPGATTTTTAVPSSTPTTTLAASSQVGALAIAVTVSPTTTTTVPRP
jgi:hypothetical protein